MDRAAENHYPTSALEEIKALAVASIAAPDCVLFLWATVPMLPQALDVMATWGFAYRSGLAWAKNRRLLQSQQARIAVDRDARPCAGAGNGNAGRVADRGATRRNRRSSTRS
jgi:hypothetical protein